MPNESKEARPSPLARALAGDSVPVGTEVVVVTALGVWPPKNIDEARKDPYLRALLDHPEWCEGEPVVATRTVDLLNETGSAFDISRRMGWQTETDLQRMFALGVKAAKHVDGDAIRIEGAERALLERDVAEVAYHAERCDDALREVTEDVAEGYDLSADDAERERWMRRQLDTMWPWLARAKAVLG